MIININDIDKKYHPKITKALFKYGVDKFCKVAQSLLKQCPKNKVVVGLLNGPSKGSYPTGKEYPRYCVRFVRNKGIEGIRKQCGPYLYISI